MSLPVPDHRFSKSPTSVRVVSLELDICCAHQLLDGMSVIDLDKTDRLFRSVPDMLSDLLLIFARDRGQPYCEQDGVGLGAP